MISNFEVKHKALVLGTFQLWLWSLAYELGFLYRGYMQLYSDNTVVRKIATNLVFQYHTKHFGVRVYFIWKKIENKDINVRYVHSKHGNGAKVWWPGSAASICPFPSYFHWELHATLSLIFSYLLEKLMIVQILLENLGVNACTNLIRIFFFSRKLGFLSPMVICI